MAEVIVTLSLTRKSGILAAAVSSLARNGLEFKSHRFVDTDDDAGLKVELMADGEVEDSGALSDALERIRGVDAVADIGVDGQSLLLDQPEEKVQPEAADQAGSTEAADVGVPKALAAEPEAGDDHSSDSGTFAANDSEAATADAANGKDSARRPMMRRRRRFT